MKRVTYSNALSFNSITVEDFTFIAPEAMMHSLQHYVFTRILRAIDIGNDCIDTALNRLKEGRRSDAARCMIEPQVAAAEWAEWIVPRLLGVESDLDFLTTLKVVAERVEREVRNEIRNYPWKAEGMIDFAQLCNELISDIECHISENYVLAHKQNKARDCGFDLDKRCVGGRNVYEAYRAAVSDSLPPYDAAEFYVALGDATGIPVEEYFNKLWEKFRDGALSQGITWEKALKKEAAFRARMEAKFKARKR